MTVQDCRRAQVQLPHDRGEDRWEGGAEARLRDHRNARWDGDAGDPPDQRRINLDLPRSLLQSPPRHPALHPRRVPAQTHFLGESTVGDIKKLIVNFTLPSVLFLAFAGVNLEGRHLVIVAVVFVACLLALLLGRLIGPPLGLRSPYFPALMTGFEAGMMGYAIFAAVYGTPKIFNFAVVDLGR